MIIVRRLLRCGVPLLLALGFTHACKTASGAHRPRPSDSANSGGSSDPLLPTNARPTFVPRPRDGTSLIGFVEQQLELGKKQNQRVLVYVGATWCEPCRQFHDAVEHGELDTPLAGLRFAEFDLDRDRSELAAAGYGSEFIPLLAIPSADGRCSPARIEGSIKGPTSVRQNLLPRLLTLLNGT